MKCVNISFYFFANKFAIYNVTAILLIMSMVYLRCHPNATCIF